jgi:hypothetical protein
VAPRNTGLPGEVQICQTRIVSGIPANLTLADGGTLVLGVDPAALFVGVPFTDLPAAATVTTGCVPRTKTDRCVTNTTRTSNVSSNTLFKNMTSYGPYGFAWRPAAPR